MKKSRKKATVAGTSTSPVTGTKREPVADKDVSEKTVKKPMEMPMEESVQSQPGPEITASVSKPVIFKQKRFWVQVIIAGIIILVGAEIFLITKKKVAVQAETIVLQAFSEQGAPPGKLGKFWGAGRILIDNERKRLCLVESMFGKLCYWDIQNYTHLMDVDKQGPYQVPPGGSPVDKQFSPIDAGMDGEGNIYVIDKKHAEVTIFSPDGKVKNSWKTIPSDRIAVDQSGIVYIADHKTSEIVQFNPEGKEVRRFGKNMLGQPDKMATDEAGNLYVVDRGNKRVVVFSSEGRVINKITPKFNPFGLLDIEAKNDKIYLASFANKQLYIYSTNGKLILQTPLSNSGIITVDADGLVFLAGAGAIRHLRIEKRFNKEGLK